MERYIEALFYFFIILEATFYLTLLNKIKSYLKEKSIIDITPSKIQYIVFTSKLGVLSKKEKKLLPLVNDIRNKYKMIILIEHINRIILILIGVIYFIRFF